MDRHTEPTPPPRYSTTIETTGLTVLYDPPKDAILDIVLVHGFNGHPERTWTYKGDDADPRHAETDPADGPSDRPAKQRKLNFSYNGRQQKKPSRPEVFWPRDLLPQTVPNARIMTFGYDTKVHHALKALHSQNTVYDHALELLSCLSDVRTVEVESRRPIHFIAHSLGGIVVKEALRQSKCYATNRVNGKLFAIYHSTASIFFLGTPHSGSDPRGFGFLANVAERAARAAGFTVNQKIYETLLPSSERLRELRDEFPVMIEEQNWTIVCFRETVGMRMFDGKKVVDENSACLGHRNLEIVRDIEGDHRAICRFRSVEDSQYRKLASELTDIVKRLQKQKEPSVESCSQEYSALEDDVEMAPQGEKTLSSQDVEELLGLLYFDQIDARLWSLRKAQAKTCKWLLATTQYRQWINVEKSPQATSNGFFWIKGKPGTGKSVMMKFLFSNAKQTVRSMKKLLISFFFNARGSELEKSTLGLYRSLLLQLFDVAPETKSVLGHLGSLGSQAIKRSGWNHEALKETFALALDKLQDRRLCCYIDALDECPEDDIRDMISFFEDLDTRQRCSSFKVCFSSRHYPEIGIKTTLQLVLENEQDHTEDIKLYIDSQLNIGNSLQAEDIKAEVLRKSSSIFLWAFLVIPMLNKEYDRGRMKGLKRRLNEIPIGLHELFIDIMTRDCKNMEEMCLCIQLVLFAKRPLRPEELRAAATLVTEGEPEKADSLTSDDLRKFILDASKGLAEITKSKKPTVQFIHESVRDFLLKEGGMRNFPTVGENVEGQSHNNLTKACTLQLETWHQNRDTHQSATKSKTGEELAATFPFLEYATAHLLDHSNSAERFGISQSEFLRTFRFQEWKEVHRRFERYKIRHYGDDVHLLYVLAERGAEFLIRTHPMRSEHFRISGGRFGLPLIAAIFAGQTAAARALVGCDLREESPLDGERSDQSRKLRIESDHQSDRDLISYLVQFGDLTLLHQVLVNRDYEQTSFQHNRLSRLLVYAASEELVDLLVEFSSDLRLFHEDVTLGTTDRISTTRGCQYQTHASLMFIWQAIQCSPDLVTRPVWDSSLLINYAYHKRFWKLFRLAISEMCRLEEEEQVRRNSRVCNSLVQNGQRPCDTKGTQWPNIFLHAARHDKAVQDEEVFGRLLSQYSDEINQRDASGRTALHLLVPDEPHCIKRLLEAGADVNATDFKGNTPLVLAIEGRSWSVFSTLLQHPECKIQCINKDGGGALHSCVSLYSSAKGHLDIISQLLALENFDVNTRDNKGRTAVEVAVAKFDFQGTKLLLDSDRTKLRQQDDPNRDSSDLLLIALSEFSRNCKSARWELVDESGVVETVRVLLISGRVELCTVADAMHKIRGLEKSVGKERMNQVRELIQKYLDGGDISKSFLPDLYDKSQFPDGPNGKFQPLHRLQY